MKTLLTDDDAGRQVLVLRSSSGVVGRRITVENYPFVIGRGSRADLDLDSPEASRSHARIERVDGAWRVVDLGSANGTFVNGERLTGGHALTSGDVIAIGPMELEWHVLRDHGLSSDTETAILDPE